MAEAEVRLKFDGPAVAGQAQENADPRKCGNRGAGPDIDLAAAAPRANERKAMITFLFVIIIPTLIILNRLEDRRSRRKVSVDGFKMINGLIARRES